MDTTPEERKAFVNEHLVDLCKELVEYDTSFMYQSNSRIRYLMKMFGNLSNARLLAEGLIRSCAVERIAQ